MTRTIRQLLKGRARLSDAVLIIGVVITAASILLWHWHSHIAFPLVGLFVVIVGGMLRSRVRCPQCLYALGRPLNYCPNCGINFDNPQYKT